jgi:hypothetical protein
MKLYPSKADCGCDADLTMETAVQAKRVYDEEGTFYGVTRDKQIFHYRERDEARFWHWSNVDDLVHI